MAEREQSYRFVEADGDYLVEVTRGHRSRRFAVSRAMLFGLGGAAALLAAGVVASASYLLFRDDMLAGLLERQTQMQYAYEDRLAALRLRLDQLASRQFIDQDGVEGKVQNLVIRQARLETRAAVVAQLVERTVAAEPRLVPAVAKSAEFGAAEARAFAPAPDAKFASKSAGAAALPLPRPPQGAVDDSVLPLSGKPQPEGMDLRLGRDADVPARPPKGVPSRNGGDRPPIGASLVPRSVTPPASLASAADPDLPMPARLDTLALSLDRIERDQARRLSHIAGPAREAASRLRRAFDVAGLSVDRYIARVEGRRAALAVGGPFVAADPKNEPLFEKELAKAESAVAALDGLRRALPTVPLRKPLAGELQLTSAFGYRTDPFFGRPALHSGVDLRDEQGAPVRATAGGVVSVAGPNGGYGNMVEVDHGGGLATRYAHLSAISVVVGQRAPPGGIVGKVGSTGRSTGPHLHYEVRIDGEAVDPQRFLRAATTLAGIAQ